MREPPGLTGGVMGVELLRTPLEYIVEGFDRFCQTGPGCTRALGVNDD